MVYVIIINYGTTSANNISKVLNQLNVLHTLQDPHTIPSYHMLNKITHIILSGGPKHVYDNEHELPLWVIEMKIPVLAICYGMQLVAHHFGGTIVRNDIEKGIVNVIELSNNIKPRWMNRYDQVMILPSQFTITEITETNHIAAFTDYIKWFCYQYHPEVEHHIDINLFIKFLNYHIL